MSTTNTKPTPRLNNFVFTERLGAGTYATVFKAYRKNGPREVVAVKCILKSSLNRISTENLLTEIELLKKLKHPHVVCLIDFEWDDNYIYLITEYCGGGDLLRFIKQRRCLSESVVQKFLQQIAAALQFLHVHKVAHMDLKPQNILLTSNTKPELKIADFGFACHLGEGSKMEMLRGSPLYMAPEIFLSKSYDARCDLWSVGIILFECLFGKAPYASKTTNELEQKIIEGVPIQIPTSPVISENCRDLINRLLQRNPDKRITFTEFFAHPFVDVDFIPSTTCREKAVQLIKCAIDYDNQNNYRMALPLYCQALRYFVPAINYESRPSERQKLRKSAHEYFARAEQLKKLVSRPPRPPPPPGILTRSRSKAQSATSSKSKDTDLKDSPNVETGIAVEKPERSTSKPHSPVDTEPSSSSTTLADDLISYKQLFGQESLEIIVDEVSTIDSKRGKVLKGAATLLDVADRLALREQWSESLDKYEKGLSGLMAVLKEETDQNRKAELTRLTDKWMQKAESVKTEYDFVKLRINGFSAPSAEVPDAVTCRVN